MAYYAIHKALTQSVIDLVLGVPVAHENADFDPTNVDTFVDLTTIFNEQRSLSKKTLDEVTGILQLGVYTRSGTSVKVSLDLVDKITNFYKHNINLVSGVQKVVIINAGRNVGRNLNGWYIIDVSVSFRSDILR